MIYEYIMSMLSRTAILEWVAGRKQQSEPDNVHLMLLG